VVPERGVLLGVEDLQQRGGGITPKVHAQLVDLVEHEDRVLRPGAAEPLDDLARQRSDVGAPVAADLGLVAHAAERDPVELAPERTRDRSPERRLADTRGAHETEDRILARRADLLDGQVLEDPVLDFLEPFVVRVEDHLGGLDIDVVGGLLLPGHGDEPVDVGPGDGVLRRRRRHLGEPVELPKRLALGLFGHTRGLDPLA